MSSDDLNDDRPRAWSLALNPAQRRRLAAAGVDLSEDGIALGEQLVRAVEAMHAAIDADPELVARRRTHVRMQGVMGLQSLLRQATREPGGDVVAESFRSGCADRLAHRLRDLGLDAILHHVDVLECRLAVLRNRCRDVEGWPMDRRKVAETIESWWLDDEHEEADDERCGT